MTDHDNDHDGDGEFDEHEDGPFGDPFDDPAVDPLAPFKDLFREKMDELEPVARRLGLYILSAGLTMAPPDQNPSGSPMPVLLTHFTVGDIAWSDRVQNADQYSTEAQFRQIAVQTEKEKFEEMQKDLQARMTEGKDLFDSIEEEEENEDGS